MHITRAYANMNCALRACIYAYKRDFRVVFAWPLSVHDCFLVALVLRWRSRNMWAKCNCCGSRRDGAQAIYILARFLPHTTSVNIICTPLENELHNAHSAAGIALGPGGSSPVYLCACNVHRFEARNLSEFEHTMHASLHSKLAALWL